MVGNAQLRRYVQERLAGRVITEHGVTVTGPTVPFTGRNRARRTDRRWALAWSPEQGGDELVAAGTAGVDSQEQQQLRCPRSQTFDDPPG